MTSLSPPSSPSFNSYSHLIRELKPLVTTRALGVVDAKDQPGGMVMVMVMVLFVIFKSLLCTRGFNKDQACFYGIDRAS